MLTSFKQKSTAFLIHLFISTLVVSPFFALVFLIWYPAPYYYTEGVEQGIILLLVVYLILGPILTLILYKPGKKGLIGDLALITIIQSSAFLYGAQLIYYERPAYVSFSFDQFKTVQAHKVDQRDLQVQSLRSGVFNTPILVSVKLPGKGRDWLRIVSESNAKGKNIYEMIQYYQPFDKTLISATKNTSGIPLKKLLKKHPEQTLTINQLKQNLQLKDDNLLFLPIQGSQNDIIVIINKLTGKAIRYLIITPWNLSSE